MIKSSIVSELPIYKRKKSTIRWISDGVDNSIDIDTSNFTPEQNKYFEDAVVWFAIENGHILEELEKELIKNLYNH